MLHFACEKLLAKNHGGHHCKNFGKWSLKVIFGKTQFDFWGGILQQKKQHFSFYKRFIFNIFFKKIMRKKLFEI